MSSRTELLKGQGRYLGDLPLGETLWASFVRSAYAHALVKSVQLTDQGSAKASGTLFTGTEIQNMVRPLRVPGNGLLEYDLYPLASDRVRYVGEPLAVVLGTDAYGAEDLAESVDVEYDPLPPVSTISEAAKDEVLLHPDLGTNVLFTQDKNYQEAESALANAPVQLEHNFRYPRQTPVPLHGRGVYAMYDPDQRSLIVYTSTQAPYAVRTSIAESLGIPEDQVRVIRPDVGGGFGGKSHVFGEELAIACLAYQLRRPVCWVEDRRENLIGSIHAHETEIRLRVGCSEDGILLVAVADVLADVGAHSVRYAGATLEPFTAAAALFGPYRLPLLGIRGRGVATNKAQAGAYRGVGFGPGIFAAERLMDMLAERLHVDPVELRLRNLLVPEDFPHTTSSGHYLDAGDYKGMMEAAAERIDYKSIRERTPEEDTARRIGVGVASAHMPAALGTSAFRRQGSPMLGGFDGVTVRVTSDGSIFAYLSSSSTGQGHDIAYRQLVGRLLQIPDDRVTIVEGDTALCPPGTATLADRSAVAIGAALHLACEDLTAKIRLIAASLLGETEQEIQIEDGTVSARNNPNNRLPFEQVAKAAHLRLGDFSLPAGVEPGLESTRFYDPPNAVWGFAAHAAVVEVDTETGQVKVLRYVLAKDPGEVINETIVEEQALGAVATGIGNALLEKVVYDDQGQMLTASLLDYLLPVADDIPSIDLVHFLTPSDTPGGYRGAGNLGTVGVPAAVSNAVANALAGEADPIDEIPITPELVLRALRKLSD